VELVARVLPQNVERGYLFHGFVEQSHAVHKEVAGAGVSNRKM
jgi:hypothetical protein